MHPSNLSPETAPVGTTLVKVDGRGKIRASFVVAKWTPTGQLVSECGTRFRPCSRGLYDTSLRILTPEIEQADAALRARGRTVRAAGGRMITRETAPVGTPIAYVCDGVIETRYVVAGWGAAERALVLSGPLSPRLFYRRADGTFPRLQILTPELEQASEAAYIAQGGWRRDLVSEIEGLGEWIYRRREQCWDAEPRVWPPFEEISGSDLEEARDLLRRAVELLGGEGA